MSLHFLEVASAVGAEPGENGYYRGIMNHAPFLLKQSSSEPPGYFFKFRKKARLRQSPLKRSPLVPVKHGFTPWHEKQQDYAVAEIRCDIEEDYIFLWIDRPKELPPESIASLAATCVRDHASLLPDQDSLCLVCGSAGATSLVQANASIAMICPACLEQKHQTHASAVEQLNASNSRASFLLPLALLGGSAVWALFWELYDFTFKVMSARRVFVPLVVVGLMVGAVGFGAGWPIGKILHRSGAVKRCPAGILAIVAAVVIVLAGEMIHVAWIVHHLTGILDWDLILHNTLPLSFGEDPRFTGTKLIFAAGLAAAIYEVSKPRSRKLRV